MQKLQLLAIAFFHIVADIVKKLCNILYDIALCIPHLQCQCQDSSLTNLQNRLDMYRLLQIHSQRGIDDLFLIGIHKGNGVAVMLLNCGMCIRLLLLLFMLLIQLY